MKHFYLLTLIIALGCTNLWAQEDLVISADRPGMATGTDVMPLHKIQWETGFAYEHSKGCPDSYTLNNTYLRYGLSEWAEVHVGADLLLCDGTTGLSALSVGTKVKMLDGAGWVPTVSFMANLASPHIGSKAYRPDHLAPQLYLLFQNDVTDWFNIGYNIGAEWDGFIAEPTTFAAVCLGFAITDDLGCFVESYNYFTTESSEYLMDLGLTWIVSPRVQLDVSAAISLTNPYSYFWAGAGVAWLIN